MVRSSPAPNGVHAHDGGGGRDVYTLTTNPLGTHKTPNQTTKTYTSPVIQGQGPNRHHIIENRSIGHLDSIYVIGLQHGIYTPKLRHRHQRIPNLPISILPMPFQNDKEPHRVVE